MHIHKRSARLAFFPAYHLEYVHGEKYTPSRADIVPARYDALIGTQRRKPCVRALLSFILVVVAGFLPRVIALLRGSAHCALLAW